MCIQVWLDSSLPKGAESRAPCMLSRLTGQNCGYTEARAWILLLKPEVAEVHSMPAVSTRKFADE